MRLLGTGKDLWVKHSRDAWWLTLAAVFVVLTAILAYRIGHIERLAAASSADAQQKFQIYHVPAPPPGADPNCDLCRLNQADVDYALKPNSVATVTFSFKQRKETWPDVIYISVNNLKGRTCKFVNRPGAQPDVQGEKGDQISFLIKQDMGADEKERIVSIACDLTVTVHAYSFTKFELPFYFAAAVASEKTLTPNIETDDTGRSATQSVAELPSGDLGKSEPAKSADPQPSKPLASAPPKKREDFKLLTLKADMHDIYAENIRFDEVPSKSANLSPGGKVVTMSWSSEELEGRKEWLLVLIGICSAAAVAALVEALRPHIDRPRTSGDAETV